MSTPRGEPLQIQHETVLTSVRHAAPSSCLGETERNQDEMYSTTLGEDRDGVHREAAAITYPVSSPLFKGEPRPTFTTLPPPRSPFCFVSWPGFSPLCPPPPPPPRDQCCHPRCCAWRELNLICELFESQQKYASPEIVSSFEILWQHFFGWLSRGTFFCFLSL